MAVINSYTFSAEEAIVPTVLGASDTVKVSLSRSSILVINNASGGSLTVNVLGDTATSTVCAGVGTIDLTGGKDFVVADATQFKIPLNTKYQDWLGDGNLTITGADTATAYVLQA